MHRGSILRNFFVPSYISISPLFSFPVGGGIHISPRFRAVFFTRSVFNRLSMSACYGERFSTQKNAGGKKFERRLIAIKSLNVAEIEICWTRLQSSWPISCSLIENSIPHRGFQSPTLNFFGVTELIGEAVTY